MSAPNKTAKILTFQTSFQNASPSVTVQTFVWAIRDAQTKKVLGLIH